MDLLEAKKTLRAHGYTLLKENEESLSDSIKKDIEYFAYYMVDEIERYLEGCEFLEGTIDGKPAIHGNRIIISVYFPQTRWPTGPKSVEIKPQTKHFQYLFNPQNAWTFDDGSRFRHGHKLNMRNYTIETLEDMDNQLGWELQKQ
ncbi:MAG TPA: hypothetical protein PKY72_05385 [Bacilli bacterium]|nr:hypothetical protein [Bacilli bacterium]